MSFRPPHARRLLDMEHPHAAGFRGSGPERLPSFPPLVVRLTETRIPRKMAPRRRRILPRACSGTLLFRLTLEIECVGRL